MGSQGVTRILSLAGHSSEQAAELEKLRRYITILFTDLKGSTAYFEKFGDAAGLLMVHRCNSMLGDAVQNHGGRVIKTIGDAVMASFDDPAEAVAASIEMQEAITRDNSGKPDGQRIAVRIGINYGLGFVKSNDVFGDVVNVASRVESAAAPEQILISDNLFKIVEADGRFRLRRLGKFALKGKAEERELYEVQWRDDPPAAHSMVVPVPEIAAKAKFRLVQVRTDGKPAKEFLLSGNAATIGRFTGEFTFPHDEQLAAAHARLTNEGGQFSVETLADAPVYLSLVGPYRLQHGDVVKLGNQRLEFHVDTALMEMMAQLGKGIGEVAAQLREPIAEFISAGTTRKQYALTDQQTTFGRTKGAHTFPTDSSMSRLHARVYHRGEDFFIEDVGSTNGSFVMVKGKTAVPPGGVLVLGGQLLRAIREE